MAHIEEILQTEIKYSCDVLVCGGGFAGIAAALAAARNGAKNVILIEKQFMLGGLGTAGLITIYLPLCDGEGHQASFGIAEELLRLSVKYDHEDDMSHAYAWLEGGSIEEKIAKRFKVRFNAQMFAMLAERLLIESGVKIIYGTSAVSVSSDGDKIEAVICENKSGRFGINLKSVVDCTGDADICHLSGENTAIFQQKNILAAWYYFANSNTNGGRYDLKMQGASDTPEKYKKDATEQISQKRYVGIDGEELSEMVIDAHEKILQNIFERRDTGDPDIVPATIATIPQIRMTRRIDGDYVMDDSEIRKHFYDSVGLFTDWRKRGPVYELPFSTLHGSKVKNLICAGRCISVTDAMWDITRVIPVCAVSGEAAGTAAAMSDDFSTIDIKALQNKLISNGVKIEIDF